MKLKNHIVSSGIVSSVVYIATNSALSAAVSFLAGVFIDLDHFIDYYLNYGFTYKIKMKEFYEVFDEIKLPKIYVFLHSFELLIVFWILIFLIPLGRIYLAVAIGMTQHIFLDQIYNPVFPRAYFLSYRLLNGFRKEYICTASKIKGT